jgi:hypothetical protein
LSIKITSVNSDSDVANVGNVLGDNVAVDVVIPEEWPRHGKNSKAKRSKDQNDNSMAIVVTDKDNGKKFLLPEDATGATLDCVIKSLNNVEKLQNIDCIIVPHHGSNLSGAFFCCCHAGPERNS